MCCPVTVVHDGATNTYLLKAEVSNLLGLKTLDLDPHDHSWSKPSRRASRPTLPI